MNNDYDETDVDGCGLTAYLFTLGFFCYACLTKGGSFGVGLSVLLGFAMLLGVALYIRGRKKRRQEKKEKEKMEQDKRWHNNIKVTKPEIESRALLQQTLAKLSLKYDFDEDQNFIVEYQGEKLRVIAENDSKTMHVHDGWWYDAPLDDIDNLSMLYKAVNEHNMSSSYTRIIYTAHQETQKIYLHILCDILWTSSISDIEEYLQAVFEAILRSHHLFYQKMEELRRKDFARRSYEQH